MFCANLIPSHPNKQQHYFQSIMNGLSSCYFKPVHCYITENKKLPTLSNSRLISSSNNVYRGETVIGEGVSSPKSKLGIIVAGLSDSWLK